LDWFHDLARRAYAGTAWTTAALAMHRSKSVCGRAHQPDVCIAVEASDRADAFKDANK
jgi:hypothetical protein